jgi:hypothetical protein
LEDPLQVECQSFLPLALLQGEYSRDQFPVGALILQKFRHVFDLRTCLKSGGREWKPNFFFALETHEHFGKCHIPPLLANQMPGLQVSEVNFGSQLGKNTEEKKEKKVELEEGHSER